MCEGSCHTISILPILGLSQLTAVGKFDTVKQGTVLGAIYYLSQVGVNIHQHQKALCQHYGYARKPVYAFTFSIEIYLFIYLLQKSDWIHHTV